LGPFQSSHSQTVRAISVTPSAAQSAAAWRMTAMFSSEKSRPARRMEMGCEERGKGLRLLK
jgi:hypothetical protein